MLCIQILTYIYISFVKKKHTKKQQFRLLSTTEIRTWQTKFVLNGLFRLLYTIDNDQLYYHPKNNDNSCKISYKPLSFICVRRQDQIQRFKFAYTRVHCFSINRHTTNFKCRSSFSSSLFYN